MPFKTKTDYQKEIARVQAAIDSTNSDYLRRDYGKYLKRLKREMRESSTASGNKTEVWR